ncbi:10743_t:CDS:2, partial [Scutellospora calospora]
VKKYVNETHRPPQFVLCLCSSKHKAVANESEDLNAPHLSQRREYKNFRCVRESRRGRVVCVCILSTLGMDTDERRTTAQHIIK